ncbi:MAG: sigma factor [Pyrinomonadaceae bacterium]
MALDKFKYSGAEVLENTVPSKPLSDHQLIEATKQGDEAAFAEIVNRYRNPITNFLYRFLNDYEEAVDLAQETFIRVYFAIERYHTDYAFRLIFTGLRQIWRLAKPANANADSFYL